MIRIGKTTVLILILAAVFLTGCADQNAKSSAKRSTTDEIATADQAFIKADSTSLTGTWSGDFETWEFKQNGSGRITENNGDDYADFTYEFDENDIIVIQVDGKDDTQKVTCQLYEYVLVLDFEDGKSFVLYKR